MIVLPILNKTRAINKIFQETREKCFSFTAIADILKKVIDANTYIIDHNGTILGHALKDEFECEIMIKQVLNRGSFPPQYNDFLLKNNELRCNLRQKSDKCVFLEGSGCLFSEKVVMVVPLTGDGKRLGTLLLARFSKLFEIDDIILSEKSSGIVGMEIMRSKLEQDEEAARSKAVAKIALNTLSYSEMEAVQNIFENFTGCEKILVTSKVADRLGMTRSVIVNALRKLISAGIIESYSLGMKGTYIKVINAYLFEQLDKGINT